MWIEQILEDYSGNLSTFSHIASTAKYIPSSQLQI